MSTFSFIRLYLVAVICLLAVMPSASAEEKEIAYSGQELPGEAAFFQLEEQVVYSASKYEQNILEVPSAITVITKEDIEKSGAIDIEQLFRAVPGALVVESDSNTIDVIFRGNPQTFSPRLLVLLDGVPIYNPLSSGVNWHFIPISLPSIERVEIIRGASSTLYGANAFSGVINIITKKVSKDQSIAFYGSGGTQQVTQEEAVWDRPISNDVRFRLSGLFRHDNGYGSDNGNGQFDGQTVGQGIFDLEADLTDKTRFKLFADGKGGSEKKFFGVLGTQSTDFNYIVSGVRLEHDFHSNSSLNFQASFLNNDENGAVGPTTGDVGRRELFSDLQYTGHFKERDTLVTGASLRQGSYSIVNVLPGTQDLTLASFFINNDLKMLHHLILTTGGRYEFDSFTHNQLSGRLNLTYLPVNDQALRVSVARAVRTPAVVEDREEIHFQDPGPPPINIDVFGNYHLRPESVLASEFGYHGVFLQKRMNADFQFYFNDLHDLIAHVTTLDDSTIPLVITDQVENLGHGQVYGFEMEFTWKVLEWWKTWVNYTLTRQLDFKSGDFPKTLINFKNQFAFRNGFSAELLFNYTSPYLFFDAFSSSAVPEDQIFRLDARLAQKFHHDHFEIGVVGQNLVDSPHTEGTPFSRVDRRVYGTFVIKY